MRDRAVKKDGRVCASKVIIQAAIPGTVNHADAFQAIRKLV
jgi:hypothetical protein